MVIGIPKESLTGETRIAVLPADIKRLSSAKLTFIIEAGAGNGSFISDEDIQMQELILFLMFIQVLILLFE